MRHEGLPLKVVLVLVLDEEYDDENERSS